MKKLGVILLTAVSAAMLLAGCGKSGGASDTITFGTNAEFPPFEYVSSSGLIDNYDGIDIAILKEIGNKKLIPFTVIVSDTF